jgi:hypothetical protein
MAAIIWDYISMSTGLLYFIPLLLYINTGQYYHLKYFLGFILTVASSEFIKLNFIKDASVRPSKAYNCDLLCTDGAQGGKPGMPSSHVASVAYIITCYISKQNSIINLIMIIYGILVAASRYIKYCHTINQIIVGTLFGSLCGVISVRYL